MTAGDRGGATRASARDVARAVLAKVEQEGAFGTLALGAALDEGRLEPADRGLVTELVYGVLRHRTRLDRALAALSRSRSSPSRVVRIALRVAAYQILFLRTPAHAAVNDAVEAVTRTAGPKVAGFTNAILRRLAREGEPPLPPETQARAHAREAWSLPDWIAAELEGAVGPDELVAAARALAEVPAIGLRVLLERTTRDDAIAAIRAERPDAELTPVPDGPEAVLLRGGAPDTLAVFRDGRVTVQDPGAQLVTRLCGAAPGETILDACTGLGGKAAHLVSLAREAGGEARIIAADLSEPKLARARTAFARLGVKVESLAADLTRPPPAITAHAYDRVLLDAPCSGLGVIRRHPEAKWRVEPADVTRLALLQAELLDAVAPLVKPGGILVYAVCTFTEAEGPAQLRAFLARNADFTLDAPVLRTFPHRQGADAFFAARLRRRA